MSYVNALEVLKEYLVMPEDLTECKWYHDTQSDSVTWTTEEDIEMLYECEGETFQRFHLRELLKLVAMYCLLYQTLVVEVVR